MLPFPGSPRRRVAIPTILLASAAPAMAQDLPTTSDVVVTGRGLDAAPAAGGADVVLIDRARIATSASNRLESVLADVAGLQQFRRSDSRSANPTSQGISLRGIGGNASSRALLILDGVPQADPFGGWVAFPAYATERLGEIRVTRGGGSGYYGPGALAGTIELDSATPAQLDAVAGRVAVGSRASVDAQGSTALIREGGFATLSGAYARGDGFVPVVAESRGLADRPARYEQATGAARAVVAIGGATELQANIAAFTDARERGTAFTDNRSEGADASIRLVGRGAWGWSALAYLQTRAFASSFASVDATRSAATQTLDQYNTPATGLGARIELAPPVGGGATLRLGADVRGVTGRTQELYTFVAARPTRRREAGGEMLTYGAFVDGSLALGTLTLAVSGRIDRWTIRDGFLSERTLADGSALTDLRFAERSGNEATGRVGATWRPLQPLTLRAAAYRGWRLPTLNELYRPFRVGADATAANAALSPERLVGYDLGVSVAPAAGVRVSATWFDNRLDDAIANVTAGRGPGNFPGVGFVGNGGVYRVRQNLDAIRARGVEIEAEVTRSAAFARGSYSHVSARVKASGAAVDLDGLRPAQTPRDALSATIGWRRDAWSIVGTLRHVARQFEDDQNLRSLAGATTLDVFASAPIADRLSIELRGENVTDARVEAGISGANIVERATPRTLWVGVRYGVR